MGVQVLYSIFTTREQEVVIMNDEMINKGSKGNKEVTHDGTPKL